eukprot:TRINITY_DN3876_c0_g1_i1.p1 TRINITY_DN3876_c0_g1~~TRINITY_DN3876_c0_g1_i1.p1  ORF type:complete len:337 (+),score=34.38 TRINITY_DN3876_c0_g1_i1:868-1878(+)
MISSIFVLIFTLLALVSLTAAQTSCIPINACFAIDESGSISATEFSLQTDALVDIAQLLDSFAPGSELSAVGFSTTTEVIQSPTPDIQGVFIPAIEENPQMSGGTLFADALALCQSLVTSASDPRVVVLLTDGVNADPGPATAAADAIKADGITLITIGVGDGVATGTLEALATSPDLFIPVTDFTTFGMAIEDIVTSLCPLPECVNFDCAKCGQILECYVNSGFDELDAAICETVLDETQFCSTRSGRGTACLQQCSGRQGVQCIPGSSFGSCPSMIGSSPMCMGGAGRNGERPADLSNFASYQACFAVGGTFDVTCLNDKCEDGSSCPCAQPFV